MTERDAKMMLEPFQKRVHAWMMECFSMEICRDMMERNHRFLEESLELVQSLGCTSSEAHQLVDYVFGRPVGEPYQETGGVKVTLAALCLAADMDMDAAGETELARVWQKIDKIRAKQAAKPKHSPLPEDIRATAAAPVAGVGEPGADLYAYIPDIVKNAMLTMWNYICDDSKHHPLDIEHGKGKFLTFEPKHWARFAGEMVQCNIHDLFAAPSLPTQPAREEVREVDCKADFYALWCDECNIHPSKCPHRPRAIPQGTGDRQMTKTQDAAALADELADISGRCSIERDRESIIKAAAALRAPSRVAETKGDSATDRENHWRKLEGRASNVLPGAFSRDVQDAFADVDCLLLAAPQEDMRGAVIEECSSKIWSEMMDICRRRGVSASKYPEWFGIVESIRALAAPPATKTPEARG